MRCNQVSIFIERFGKYVPKNYPADVQRVSVYCDDFESIYAALSKAYAMAINELNEYDHIGARCDVHTNEFSHVDYREMHSTLPIEKRKYGQDYDFEWSDTAKPLYEDFVWVYEHRTEIVEAISGCQSSEDFSLRLKEKFNLDDVQVKKLSQIRLDMLTKERYDDAKASLQKIEEIRNRQRRPTGKVDSLLWIQRRIQEVKREIGIIEAYLKGCEHYQEIMEVVINSGDGGEYAETMEQRFGFTREQSRSLRYCCANDFSQKKREEKEKKLQELRKRLTTYEKDLKAYNEE